MPGNEMHLLIFSPLGSSANIITIYQLYGQLCLLYEVYLFSDTVNIFELWICKCD